MSITISTCIYGDNNFIIQQTFIEREYDHIAIPDRFPECLQSLFLGFGDKNSLPGKEM